MKQSEFWLLYRVRDKFPFIKQGEKIVRVEYLQHWFASAISAEFRTYLEGNGATKIKYGSYVVNDKKIAEGFKTVAESMRETLSSKLENSKRHALKRKDSVALGKIEARISYLSNHYTARIKPKILVLEIIRINGDIQDQTTRIVKRDSIK